MASKLGQPNVDLMLRGITARQFVEWRHYADIEPFDEERDDYRAASIVQAVFNAAVLVVTRGKKAGDVKLEKCLLKFGARAAAQPGTADHAKALVEQSMRAMEDHIAIQRSRKRKRG